MSDNTQAVVQVQVELALEDGYSGWDLVIEVLANIAAYYPGIRSGS